MRRNVLHTASVGELRWHQALPPALAAARVLAWVMLCVQTVCMVVRANRSYRYFGIVDMVLNILPGVIPAAMLGTHFGLLLLFTSRR